MDGDFIVVDTEGSDILTEVAILDAQGKRLFEGFVATDTTQHDSYTLPALLQQFTQWARGKKIVCHYAEHDETVLKNSFAQAQLPWPNFEFICSFEWAKSCFPKLTGYSLEHLSKSLHLQVNQQYFNSQAAHSALYDAQFTQQLYRKILQHNQSDKKHPNPFSNTRVDNPFQHHPDFDSIHHHAFLRLTTVLQEIKNDGNQQSRGVVILGEAGNGKTHLMMRLALRTLSRNRLFFIRQPNHEEAVLHHIYSRMLESFIELIPDTAYSQLEYLLGIVFAKIVIQALQAKPKLSKNEDKILRALLQDHLNIYEVLGKDGTEVKRRNWDYIERHTLLWWQKHHGFSDYAPDLIRGLIKFCRYSEVHKRESVRRWLAGHYLSDDELVAIGLKNWQEQFNREDFALQAMMVFGKLSVINEPLIIIFDQLEGLKYNQTLLLRFGEAIKELFTHVPNSLILFNLFPDRWRYFKQYFDSSITERIGQCQVQLSLPAPDELKEMLALKLAKIDSDIDTLFEPQELQTILSHRSIREVLNCAADYYRHKVDGVALPQNVLSFEVHVERTLQQLQQRILKIEQHLSLKTAVTEIQLKPVEQTKIESYVAQKKQQLNNDYAKKTILSDTDDLGKLVSILHALKSIKPFEIEYLHLGKLKLPEHVLIHSPHKKAVVAFLHADAYTFTTRIKNFNQLIINHKDAKFLLFRDVREPTIKSRIALGEIEKLSNSENGRYLDMTADHRLGFELVYHLILDIQNHDFNAELDVVLPVLMNTLGEQFWLFRALNYSFFSKKAVT